MSVRDRWAILGGALVVSQSSLRQPFWVWNCSARQLYMSPYHLSPQFIPYYLDALAKYRIRYLYGYSVSLRCLAVRALRRGWQSPGFVVRHHECGAALRSPKAHYYPGAFNCPVRETYGMAEIVTAAGECDHGQLHLWPEVGIVEIMNGSDPVPLGGTGDLVCTGLLNADMPLVRYRLGDTGGLNAPEPLCPCGRRLPTLQPIQGRTDDLFVTADGRLVPHLDPVYSDDAPFREAQLIQESLHRIRVRYVPTSEFNKEAAMAMIKHIRDRMGDVEVILDAVAEIPRGPGGKFREAVCNLRPEELPPVSMAALEDRGAMSIPQVFPFSHASVHGVVGETARIKGAGNSGENHLRSRPAMPAWPMRRRQTKPSLLSWTLVVTILRMKPPRGTGMPSRPAQCGGTILY